VRHFYCAWDQAFANSGFALLEWDESQSKLLYVNSHVFHPSIKWGHKSDAIAFLEHQKHLKDTLEEVRSRGALHSIGIEGVAFSAPGQAASRGGIWALYSTMSVLYGDVVVISPTRLKKYLTGFGFAEKEDVKKVIESKYNLKGKELAFDEYDAIGLAEMAAYAYMITNGREDQIKKLLTDEQYLLFKDKRLVNKIKKAVKLPKKKKKASPKDERMKGICDRPDDFYITKRSN
jgi:Holliday junction resolvasome RuvABC endonuclease subunit